MKFNLLKIEERLQIFFEEKLWFPVNKDPFNLLSREIMSAYYSHTEKNGSPPNIFRINLNSDFYANLDSGDIDIWKDFIKDILLQTARENHYRLSGPIHIQHFLNENQKEKIIVDTSSSKKSSGDTVNILGYEIHSENEKIIPGYLITPDEKVFDLEKKVINIGRKEDNDLVLDNLRVSRVHAQIRQIKNQHVLFDLSSTTGTKVNGKKVSQKPLSQGDVIEIADVALIYGMELNNKEELRQRGHTRIISPDQQ